VGTVHVIPAESEHNVHEKVCTLLLARVLEKPDLTVSVFAGTPALGLYRTVVERAAAEHVDLTHVRFVVLDELVLPDRSAPFQALLRSTLFEPLGVPAANLLWFNPAQDPIAEVARISARLGAAGIDVCLLSVDSRGHIGFHNTGADQGGRAGLVPVENHERWKTERAFSLGLRDLGEADTVLLFSTGLAGAAIVSELVEGVIEPSRPASLLQRHNRVILVADRESLSRLREPSAVAGMQAGLRIVDGTSVPTGRSVLVVSPHPDDAPISVGGAMVMLSPGNRLTTAIMTTGHRAHILGKRRDERIALRESEVVRESRFLGTTPRFLRLPFYERGYEVTEADIEPFLGLIREVAADWVFLPQSRDAHPAHIASRNVALEALKRHRRERDAAVDIWTFEGPWSLFGKDDFQAVFSVPPEAFERKLQAIRCHESQLERTPYDVAADALARMRASLVPESSLAGFGKKPPRLEPCVEVYGIERGV
jgi:glucosamine-6-phosphate deaminase